MPSMDFWPGAISSISITSSHNSNRKRMQNAKLLLALSQLLVAPLTMSPAI